MARSSNLPFPESALEEEEEGVVVDSGPFERFLDFLHLYYEFYFPCCHTSETREFRYVRQNAQHTRQCKSNRCQDERGGGHPAHLFRHAPFASPIEIENPPCDNIYSVSTQPREPNVRLMMGRLKGSRLPRIEKEGVDTLQLPTLSDCGEKMLLLRRALLLEVMSRAGSVEQLLNNVLHHLSGCS